MSDRFLDLAKGEADVAIRGNKPAHATLVGRKIADVPWAAYASRSYVQQHGRPDRPEQTVGHTMIGFVGEIADHQAAQWLRTVAPSAAVSGHSSNIPSVLMAVKSNAGLAPLPAPIADRDDDLVRVLRDIPYLRLPMYLLTHPDLRQTPRVKAFFDFAVAEMRALRPVLTGAAGGQESLARRMETTGAS